MRVRMCLRKNNDETNRNISLLVFIYLIVLK